jgi:hypothetical protein
MRTPSEPAPDSEGGWTNSKVVENIAPVNNPMRGSMQEASAPQTAAAQEGGVSEL